jgi:tetratricopeptide (TPR) repeat protein
MTRPMNLFILNAVCAFLVINRAESQVTSEFAPGDQPVVADLDNARSEINALMSAEPLGRIHARKHAGVYSAHSGQRAMTAVVSPGLAAPAFLAASQAPTQSSELDEINKIYQAGKQLRDNDQFDAAIRLYESSKYSRHPKIFNGIISSYAGKRNYAIARRKLSVEYPTKNEADKLDAYFNVGVYYQDDGDYIEAKEMFQRAAALGDQGAARRLISVNQLMEVRTFEASHEAADILYQLYFANDPRRRARLLSLPSADAQSLEARFVAQIEGDRLRDGGTTTVHYGKQELIYALSALRGRTFRVLRNEQFSMTLEGRHRLLIKTPLGTFRLQLTYDPQTTFNRVSVTRIN